MDKDGVGGTAKLAVGVRALVGEVALHADTTITNKKHTITCQKDRWVMIPPLLGNDTTFDARRPFTVMFSILDCQDARREPTRNPLRFESRVGPTQPLFATQHGLVLATPPIDGNVAHRIAGIKTQRHVIAIIRVRIKEEKPDIGVLV